MKINLFKTLTLTLFVLLSGLSSQAQEGVQGRWGNKPGRKEAAAYVRQNVLPVVRQQRLKLEEQLSAADKSQLATYRTQLQQVRERGKALRQSLRPAAAAANTPRAALTDAQKQQLQQLRTESRAAMLNVAQLAQKYDANISKLAQEVEPQKAKWTADLQAIAGKYAPASDQPNQLARTGKGRHKNGAGRFFRPAVFLLMDPNAPQQSDRAERLGADSNVYPNPAVVTSQLEYSVKKAGPVTIDLLDSRGNTLRTVQQSQQQEKGPQTLSVNVGDLPSGTYYYKITTRAGSETKRFVKQ
ncbi:T9SS type A sorting domain-containing protein [Hymenobacter jejuensis]|uniref:T9SS type A sorting domain-containing protein n=1 Tax=Hymenobacter jejuensis TaxID=2502781 RepID=A0A5B7ZW20_9BACT|nr:T9SS type A sorting domain-containing protein [Hymenobacter jejuensis]QDA59168.1 T9SS type A sorting domain-containing protein [Hymenobacter jejuensis]